MTIPLLMHPRNVGLTVPVALRRQTKRISRTWMALTDGPYAGARLHMGTGDGYHTLPFTLGAHTGRYVHGNWEPTP